MKMGRQDQMIVHLPDTRGVVISDWGKGNLKLGPHTYTYSRLAGKAETCPGASVECEAVCYAKRLTRFEEVRKAWARHSKTEAVPDIDELPQGALIRLHVSGDFTTVRYIRGWVTLMRRRPDVTLWSYTRSWRVKRLLPDLEVLRALPNVELFASMDASMPDLPPEGWRRAWLDGDPRGGQPVGVRAHREAATTIRRNRETYDGVFTYVCPEETKHKASCEACQYCFKGKKGDVTFLRH
jgi:hypothetical protein